MFVSQGGSAGRMTSHAKYCLFTLVAKVTSHGRLLVQFCASDLQNMLDNRGCGQLHNTIHGASHAFKQCLAFLSLKFGNGRWRRRRPKLDNFSTSLQHDGAKNHWFWRFRTLELCLNYDIIHLTRGSTLGPAAKNLTENRRKSHTFAFSKTAPFWVHVIPADPPCLLAVQ